MKKSMIIFLLMNTFAFAQSFIEKTEEVFNYNLSGKKIAVIIGNEVDYNEAIDLPAYWQKWGAIVTQIGTEKIIKSHSIEYKNGKIGLAQSTIQIKELLDDFDYSIYDVIYFPGGNSPDDLLKFNKDKVLNLIRKADKDGKIIAAFCHGPVLLLNAGIISGKTVTGEVDKDVVENANGIFKKEIVVVDKNIITGNYPFIESFAAAVAEKLCGETSYMNIYRSDYTNTLNIAEHFCEKPIAEKDIKKIVKEASLTVNDFFINSYKPWKVVAVQSDSLNRKLFNLFSKSILSFYYSKGLDSSKIKARIISHLKTPAYLLIYIKNTNPDIYLGNYIENESVNNRLLGLNAGEFVYKLRLAANKIGLGTNLLNGLPFLSAEKEINNLVNIKDDDLVLTAVLELGFPLDETLSQPLRPLSEILTIK